MAKSNTAKKDETPPGQPPVEGGSGPITEADTKEPLKPETKAPASTEPPKYLSGRLLPFRADLMRTVYCITAEDGHTLADVMRPEYWRNVTADLDQNFRVEVLFTGEDQRWVDLLVMAKGATFAKVKLLHNIDLNESADEISRLRAQEEENGYRIFHKGGQHRWAVERKSDKTIVSSGHATQREADTWLDDHKKVMRK